MGSQRVQTEMIKAAKPKLTAAQRTAIMQEVANSVGYKGNGYADLVRDAVFSDPSLDSDRVRAVILGVAEPCRYVRLP